MRFMDKCLDKIKRIISRCNGQIYLSSQLKETKQKKVLHISDTPDSIYPFIFKVINQLKPDIIIHTGDLVDNIKLGLGASKKEYSRQVKSLLTELEKELKTKIYVVPGNHDAVDIIQKYSHYLQIKKEGSIIQIDEVEIEVAHYLENLSREKKVNLYGHNKKILKKKDKIFLNGILNLNIILIPSLSLFQIPYPLRTDSERQYRSLKLP